MLQQTSFNTRTLFLEFFTKELVLNSKPKEISLKKQEIVKEELEKKIEEEEKTEEKGEIIKIEDYEKMKEYIPSPKVRPLEIMPIIETKKHLPPNISKKTTPPNLSRHQINLLPTIQPIPLQKKFTMPISSAVIQPKFTIPVSRLPKAEGEINLGKLNMLLTDKEITMIECPGPDKFVIVKKADKINLTKITLSQKEIDEIIENFSQSARIPIIGGVFKASVGNLIISAIISGFIGSRFIIYKTSFYSIIVQQPQQEGQLSFP